MDSALIQTSFQRNKNVMTWLLNRCHKFGIWRKKMPILDIETMLSCFNIVASAGYNSGYKCSSPLKLARFLCSFAMKIMKKIFLFQIK
jgi:hypothetical protein